MLFTTHTKQKLIIVTPGKLFCFKKHAFFYLKVEDREEEEEEEYPLDC